MAYGSFEDGGITVQSSELNDEQLAANLAPVVDDTVVESDDEAPAVAVIEPKVEPKPNPRKDPQARVEAATAKEAAAKRERDEAKAESAKLQARIAELEAKALPKVEPKPAPASMPTKAEWERYRAMPDAPKLEEFANYEDWNVATTLFVADKRDDEREHSRQEKAAQQWREDQNKKIDHEFGERWSAAIAEDPSFTERVNPILRNTQRVGALLKDAVPTFDNFLVEQIFRSPHPKALALHLSDPQTYQRLATLHPMNVIEELAIFNHSQSAASHPASAPKAPAVSHAKPPITPVGSSPVAADPNELTGEESVDEHIRKMNAVERRARRAS